MTVAAMMEYMDPQYRQVLKTMLAREGASDELPVEQVLKLFPSNKAKSREEGMAIVSLIGASYKNKVGKFSPKLTHQQRCEILGLHILGYTREVLCKMYGVDRRTITHIYNPKSTHYKNVREEVLRMGKEEFLNMFVTEEVQNRAREFTESAVGDEANNKQANRKAGLHMLKNDLCDFDHRVIIQWVEGGVPTPGWYYKDLDSEWPDDWFTVAADPDSLKTSQACYAAALTDISDKL